MTTDEARKYLKENPKAAMAMRTVLAAILEDFDGIRNDLAESIKDLDDVLAKAKAESINAAIIKPIKCPDCGSTNIKAVYVSETSERSYDEYSLNINEVEDFTACDHFVCEDCEGLFDLEEVEGYPDEVRTETD